MEHCIFKKSKGGTVIFAFRKKEQKQKNVIAKNVSFQLLG